MNKLAIGAQIEPIGRCPPKWQMSGPAETIIAELQDCGGWQLQREIAKDAPPEKCSSLDQAMMRAYNIAMGYTR